MGATCVWDPLFKPTIFKEISNLLDEDFQVKVNGPQSIIHLKLYSGDMWLGVDLKNGYKKKLRYKREDQVCKIC